MILNCGHDHDESEILAAAGRIQAGRKKAHKGGRPAKHAKKDQPELSAYERWALDHGKRIEPEPEERRKVEPIWE